MNKMKDEIDHDETAIKKSRSQQSLLIVDIYFYDYNMARECKIYTGNITYPQLFLTFIRYEVGFVKMAELFVNSVFRMENERYLSNVASLLGGSHRFSYVIDILTGYCVTHIELCAKR